MGTSQVKFKGKGKHQVKGKVKAIRPWRRSGGTTCTGILSPVSSDEEIKAQSIGEEGEDRRSYLLDSILFGTEI